LASLNVWRLLAAIVMVNLHAPTGEWAVRNKNGSGAFGIPERMPPVGGDCYGKQAFDMIEAQASRVPQTYGRTCRLTGKGRLPKDFLPIRAENPGTTQNMRRTVTVSGALSVLWIPFLGRFFHVHRRRVLFRDGACGAFIMFAAFCGGGKRPAVR